MKYWLLVLCMLTVLISCKTDQKKKVLEPDKEVPNTSDYEVFSCKSGTKAVLVLFGGFGEKPKDIQREFPIWELAENNNVSVVFMNYSQKLWLEDHEKEALASTIQEAFDLYDLPTEKVFIGGFSSGGIVSLLLSDYLREHQNLELKPMGVFIVDSPIDLLELYRASLKNIKRNYSEVSVQESTWLKGTLEAKMGNPEKGIETFEAYSVYIQETDHIENLIHLKNTKIRLYTETDFDWWKENRMADKEQINAYHIEKLSESLHRHGFVDVSLITSQGKGYRADGRRHPHSWSIVDRQQLLDWILK